MPCTTACRYFDMLNFRSHEHDPHMFCLRQVGFPCSTWPVYDCYKKIIYKKAKNRFYGRLGSRINWCPTCLQMQMSQSTVLSTSTSDHLHGEYVRHMPLVEPVPL
jgi:hypothetical protein